MVPLVAALLCIAATAAANDSSGLTVDVDTGTGAYTVSLDGVPWLVSSPVAMSRDWFRGTTAARPSLGPCTLRWKECNLPSAVLTSTSVSKGNGAGDPPVCLRFLR